MLMGATGHGTGGTKPRWFKLSWFVGLETPDKIENRTQENKTSS